MPGHRALAMLRGWNEEVLTLDIEVDADDTSAVKPVERMIAGAYAISATGGAADDWLMEVVRWTWRVKLSLIAVARPDDASCASAPRKRRSASSPAI